MKTGTHNFLKAIQPHVYIARDRDASGIDGRIVAQTDRHSHIAEQYRMLQTHLYALNKDKKMRSIVITSSVTKEGKTLTCCNLAITLAADTEKKVVLVDCDLRKPEIHSMLNIKQSPGVTDMIEGRNETIGLVKSGIADNLFILPAGTTASNPSELLRRPEMRTLLDSLKELYDFVIIDTPPIIPVSDSRMMGALCDAVIVVVKADTTSITSIKEASWLLETAYTKPIACILTNHQPLFYQSAGYSRYYEEHPKE